MRFSNWLPSLALLASLAVGSPVQQLEERNFCILPAVRKEWRTLSKLEKLSFLNAVKCLHAKPAKLAGLYAGVTTRFEDFTAIHKYKTPYIHMTGLFLPWHRLFIAEYEKALKLECGYIGSLPYWDYTIDSSVGSNFTTSPVFHNTYGFGGNGEYDPAQAEPAVPGVWGGGCVKTGPFKNWEFHVQRDRPFEYVTRCLKRNLWVEFTEWTRQDKEDAVYAQTNFRDMLLILEGTVFDPWYAIHSGGHVAIGGPFTGDGTAVDSWTSTLYVFCPYSSSNAPLANKFPTANPSSIYIMQISIAFGGNGKRRTLRTNIRLGPA